MYFFFLFFKKALFIQLIFRFSTHPVILLPNSHTSIHPSTHKHTQPSVSLPLAGFRFIHSPVHPPIFQPSVYLFMNRYIYELFLCHSSMHPPFIQPPIHLTHSPHPSINSPILLLTSLPSTNPTIHLTILSLNHLPTHSIYSPIHPTQPSNLPTHLTTHPTI